jgi:hypothetical protein
LKLNHGLPKESAGGFRSARWNLVLLAAQSQVLPDSQTVPLHADEEIHALCETLIASEGTVRSMKTEPQRTCPSCGNEFSGAMEFCPVCVLRKALVGGVASGESSASEEETRPTPERAVKRFEHYELVPGKDGKPVELGRGAMGGYLQGVRRRSALPRNT